MSERDPRIDPTPGDRLAKGRFPEKRTVRTVKRLPGQGPIHGGLGFISSGRYRTVWPLQILPWRKWAAGAEVIHTESATAESSTPEGR